MLVCVWIFSHACWSDWDCVTSGQEVRPPKVSAWWTLLLCLFLISLVCWQIQTAKTCTRVVGSASVQSVRCEFYNSNTCRLLNQQLHIICQNHFPCVSNDFYPPRWCCVVLTAKLSSACHAEPLMKITKYTDGITGERQIMGRFQCGTRL